MNQEPLPNNLGLDEELVSLTKQAAKWRFLSALFFYPSMWYIMSKEKHLREAVARRDVEEARRLVGSMKTAAIGGTLAGAVVLVILVIALIQGNL